MIAIYRIIGIIRKKYNIMFNVKSHYGLTRNRSGKACVAQNAKLERKLVIKK